jgi:protein-tyrosine phosphatase
MAEKRSSQRLNAGQIRAKSFIRMPEGEMHERRLITLQGVVNFRDIGGYRTESGKTVAWGKVYRAGSLGMLTDADRAALTAFGVRSVIDMRSAEEVREEPDRLPDGVRYVPMPLYRDASAPSPLKVLLSNANRMEAFLAETYTNLMVDENAALFGRVLNHIADADNLPVVIHCTAGKDRTGISIMLLLKALGVPDDVVIADYSLTNLCYDALHERVRRTIRNRFLRAYAMSKITPLLCANPDLMQATMEHIRRKHSSIEAYLAHAGVDATGIARLHDLLLT